MFLERDKKYAPQMMSSIQHLKEKLKGIRIIKNEANIMIWHQAQLMRKDIECLMINF